MCALENDSLHCIWQNELTDISDVNIQIENITF